MEIYNTLDSTHFTSTNISTEAFFCSICISPAFVFIANSEHLFAEIHAAPAVSRDPTQIWWMDAFYGLRDTRMKYTC